MTTLPAAGLLPATPTAAPSAAVDCEVVRLRSAYAYGTEIVGDLPFLQTILLSPFFFTFFLTLAK
jgi:hypothetical protein